ncbi:MAG: LysE family translocator [Pseudomonadota bacterium]
MLADLLSVAGLTALIMISPGPDLALVARNTVIGGKSAGGWTSAGVLTGNLVHFSYCLAGVGWLIATSAVAFTVLKLAGGAYLIYLGIQSLRPGPAHAEAIEPAIGHGRRWWVQGLLNNLLNPKGPLFYLGVIAVFVAPDSSQIYMALLLLTTIGVSAAFWVLFVYVLQIASVRSRLRKAGRWIGRLLGAVLVALGIRLWLTEAPDFS